MYAIKNSNGLYVGLPGRKNSFTNVVRNAQKFNNKEDAQAQCCGNEWPVKLDLVWGVK